MLGLSLMFLCALLEDDNDFSQALFPYSDGTR